MSRPARAPRLCRCLVRIETDHHLCHCRLLVVVAADVGRAGQCLFEQSRPLFSHTPPEASAASHSRATTLTRVGQPVHEQTIRDPDPKLGLRPGSPPVLTRGRIWAEGGDRCRSEGLSICTAAEPACWRGQASTERVSFTSASRGRAARILLEMQLVAVSLWRRCFSSRVDLGPIGGSMADRIPLHQH